MSRKVDRSKTPTEYWMSLWNACGFWPDDFPFGPNRVIAFVLADDYKAKFKELSERIIELQTQKDSLTAELARIKEINISLGHASDAWALENESLKAALRAHKAL
jgi:hypothetical protein